MKPVKIEKKLKTILIIEDEFDIRYSLKDFLELEGYNVFTAENGLEALKILENSEMPNLILLDMKMPKMDGWTFAKEYLAKFKQVSPIIVMTAAGEAKERASDIKAVGWLEKPFDLEVLSEKIKQYEMK